MLVIPIKYPHARVKRIIIDWQLIIMEGRAYGGAARRFDGNGKFSTFPAQEDILFATPLGCATSFHESVSVHTLSRFDKRI